ncbi:MAG TPA: FAD-dependent oxidoreductase, partial [Bacteroidia bacterium]|nr:FAD-dependent oxidoreductase [Bacteroidia bacterium]
FRCENGNQSLADELARRILENKNNRILLNNPVKKIKIKSGGGGGVEVWDTWSQEAHKADYLILAIPPTTWDNIDISPNIPMKDYGIQMGTAVKYLSKVRNRFWIKAQLAPSGAGDNVGMFWEGTDNQTLNGEQAIELSVFAGAQNALDALNSSSVSGFYTSELGKIYRDYSTNVYSARFEAWPKRKWTKAGYSFPKMGQVLTISKNLSEPFHERLYFAGEHTCTAFFGYMEGALQSGMRVAKKLL